jgi:hypothetical protein
MVNELIHFPGICPFTEFGPEPICVISFNFSFNFSFNLI